jgi:hypothetical protein
MLKAHVVASACSLTCSASVMLDEGFGACDGLADVVDGGGAAVA